MSEMKNYDDDQLLCRTVLRHNWHEAEGESLTKASPNSRALFGWTLMCSRCGMKKVVFMDRKGHIESVRYAQPTGYKLAGYQQIKFRQELIRRKNG